MLYIQWQKDILIPGHLKICLWTREKAMRTYLDVLVIPIGEAIFSMVVGKPLDVQIRTFDSFEIYAAAMGHQLLLYHSPINKQFLPVYHCIIGTLV